MNIKYNILFNFIKYIFNIICYNCIFFIGVCIDFVYIDNNVKRVLYEMLVFEMVIRGVLELVDISNMLVLVMVDYLYLFLILGYVFCYNSLFGK